MNIVKIQVYYSCAKSFGDEVSVNTAQGVMVFFSFCKQLCSPSTASIKANQWNCNPSDSAG